MGESSEPGPAPGRIAFETARLRLARYQLQGEQSRAQAAQHAAQVSAEALEVERVGVWLFKERRTRLVCASLYVRSRGEHLRGQVLTSQLYPGYVRALQQRRAIAADDARAHPETRELTDTYLAPNGITSMLDAPIIHDGQVVGVVCHEHVGTPRHWTEREIAFAGTVADMITLVFAQADRLELEGALKEQALQRLEHQKMEALGRLATAVAHDFNNLLQTVHGTLTLLHSGAVLPAQLDLDQLDSLVDFGRRLTQQLMTFGRAHNAEPEQPVDLAALLDRMEPLLRGGIPRAIALEIRVTAHEPTARCVPSQMEQVLLNLTLNARDAIEGTGTVSILLRDSVAEDDLPPDHLVLEVRDDGAGMSPATCERIFEPYFTTKAGGTGLGLAAVYGIVQRAGGVVRAVSTPGAGTRMLVALPRAASTAP